MPSELASTRVSSSSWMMCWLCWISVSAMNFVKPPRSGMKNRTSPAAAWVRVEISNLVFHRRELYSRTDASSIARVVGEKQ